MTIWYNDTKTKIISIYFWNIFPQAINSTKIPGEKLKINVLNHSLLKLIPTANDIPWNNDACRTWSSFMATHRIIRSVKSRSVAHNHTVSRAMHTNTLDHHELSLTLVWSSLPLVWNSLPQLIRDITSTLPSFSKSHWKPIYLVWHTLHKLNWNSISKLIFNCKVSLLNFVRGAALQNIWISNFYVRVKHVSNKYK